MRSKRSQIGVTNSHKAYKIDDRLIKKMALYTLEYCKTLGAIDLEVVFMSDADIRRFNRRYKGEDRSTDVLSFELDGAGCDPKSFLGEIFISIDKARKNSKIFETAFEEELMLYVIHGILHLSGYDDETPKERARMEKKQKEILQKLCAREDLSKVLMPR